MNLSDVHVNRPPVGDLVRLVWRIVTFVSEGDLLGGPIAAGATGKAADGKSH